MVLVTPSLDQYGLKSSSSLNDLKLRSFVKMDFLSRTYNVRTRDMALLDFKDLLSTRSIDCDLNEQSEFGCLN